MRPWLRTPIHSFFEFSGGPPTRAHVDIALLEAEPGMQEKTPWWLIHRMRERAAAMGCDAVVISQIDTHVDEIAEHKTVTGTCIAYTAAK